MKEKIISILKFVLFLWLVIFGFFSTYAVLWVNIGLPVNTWASVIVLSLTLLSAFGYIEWLRN